EPDDSTDMLGSVGARVAEGDVKREGAGPVTRQIRRPDAQLRRAVSDQHCPAGWNRERPRDPGHGGESDGANRAQTAVALRESGNFPGLRRVKPYRLEDEERLDVDRPTTG